MQVEISTPLETLNLLPETKDQVNSFIELAKEQILDGNFSFKELLFRKKLWLETIEGIFSDPKIKSHLEDEFKKEGTKQVGFNGSVIECKTRKTWSYDKCNDSVLKEYEEKAKPYNDGVKDRQKFLQFLKKPEQILNEETGELETIYPAAFTESSFFQVTLK